MYREAELLTYTFYISRIKVNLFFQTTCWLCRLRPYTLPPLPFPHQSTRQPTNAVHNWPSPGTPPHMGTSGLELTTRSRPSTFEPIKPKNQLDLTLARAEFQNLARSG